MKRFLSVVLALLCCVACVGMLAGCGEQEETQGGDGTNDIFSVEYKGTKIQLGADAADIISSLGEAKSVDNQGDCFGLGAQIKYKYDNFNIYTLKSESSEIIDGISFTSDIVTTSKGICISSDSSKVIEKYGEPTTQDDSAIRYKEGKYILKFGIEDGAVTKIDYITETQAQ